MDVSPVVRRSRPPRSKLALRRLDSNSSRAKEISALLRGAIVRGQLVPGAIYSVGSLATLLGVSRTPVREALIELASHGMVRFERNRGVRILQTSVHDIAEIFEIRRLLEVPAARRAVENLEPSGLRSLQAEFRAMERATERGDEQALWIHDRAFHRTLLQLSGNRRLADYVDNLRDMVLLRGVTTAGRSRSLLAIAQEHLPILQGAEQHDPNGTAHALDEHLRATEALLIAQESEAVQSR